MQILWGPGVRLMRLCVGEQSLVSQVFRSKPQRINMYCQHLTVQRRELESVFVSFGSIVGKPRSPRSNFRDCPINRILSCRSLLSVPPFYHHSNPTEFYFCGSHSNFYIHTINIILKNSDFKINVWHTTMTHLNELALHS